MDGKLTDEHKSMLDDDNLYKALRDYEGFKRIKGLYFPLSRQGNIVVTTQDQVTGHGNGTINQNLSDKRSKVIEWTALTDTDARAEYTSFAESTDLKVTSVGKVKNEDGSVTYRARVLTQGVYFFDSEREARKFVKRTPGASQPETRKDLYNNTDMTGAHVTTIMQSIERSNMGDAGKKMAQRAVQDAAIRSLTGNRVQKHRLQRQGVRGASRDLLRTTFDYVNTSAGFLARLRHMSEVRDAFQEMEEITSTTEDKNKPARRDVINELRRRYDENVTNPKAGNKIVNDIMLLSYLDKLASPAYSVVNGMQPWMVTGPILGGRHGFLRAGSALNSAYNAIGAWSQIGSGLANTGRGVKQFTSLGLDTTDIFGSILKNVASQKDGEFLTKVLTYANERTPLLDAGFELAGAIGDGRGMWGVGLSKVDRIARQLPMAVEAVNRAVTLVAAARLAKADNVPDPIKYAFDTMQNTQGDYSVQNQPRWFNNPILRPALQFKKYAQMMSHLMYDMVHRANFSTKEGRVAVKQLMGIAGMQIAFAGAMGLPGLEIAKAIVMVAALFGGDDWEEWEKWLEGIAKSSMGGDVGEMFTKGIVPRGMGLAIDAAFGKGMGLGGIDLSSRLSLADMWTGFSEPKGSDRDSVLAYFGNLMAGAPGSMALDWLEGGKAVTEGRFLDASIKLIPLKFMSDSLKAAKGHFDETASIPVTATEAFIQTTGFRTGRMAQAGEKIGERIKSSKDLEQEKKSLQREWLSVTTKGEELKIKVKIAQHNKRAEQMNKPTMKVYTRGLDKIRSERSKERAALIGG
jgi:hypothetical protein